MEEASAFEVYDDPEIIPDRTESAPEGPQAADDVFWSRMGAMFDRRKDRLGHDMTCRLNHLAAEVKTGINVEREHRLENMREVNNIQAIDDKLTMEKERRDMDMTHMSNVIEELTRRVAGSEGAAAQESAVLRASRVGSAIVIGTWPSGTEAEHRRRESQPLLASLSGMECVLIAPARSSIVTLEFGGPHDPTMNKWRGLERDRDIVAKRRHLRRAEERLQLDWQLEAAARYNTAEGAGQHAYRTPRYFSR